MWPFIKMPGSGNVWQDYEPSTQWFSPTINIAGKPEVEREVVEKVASYGTQLGALTDVVLALADMAKSPEAPAAFIKDRERLRQIAKDVKAVKERKRESALHEAKEALSRLEEENPAAYRAVVRTAYEGVRGK